MSPTVCASNTYTTFSHKPATFPHASYWLSVQVTIRDNGTPQLSSTTRVVVKVTDENDNEPQFIEQLYRVPIPEMPSATYEEPLLR